MLLAWAVASFVYYGLSLNSGNLGGSLHVNFALSALVEIPADLGSGYLIELRCLGRRGTLAGALLIGGLACMACVPLNALYPPAPGRFAPAQASALLGKFAVSSAFSIVFVYCAELFPTSVRNLAVGLSSTAARVGGVAAPAVVLLGTISDQLPVLVFASAALLAGAYCCTLPETRGRPTPETIDDVRPSPPQLRYL